MLEQQDVAAHTTDAKDRDHTSLPTDQRVEQTVAELLGPDRYRRDFAGSVRLELRAESRGAALLIHVPTDAHARFLRRRFDAELQAAANALVDDQQVTLDWRVDPERFSSLGTTAPVSDEPAPIAPPVEKPRRRTQRHRLDEFVVGECNRTAFHAVQALAEGQLQGECVLFLHGPCGVGKTHLLQACESAHRSLSGGRSRYITCEEFSNQYVAAVRSGDRSSFRERFRHLDLLCIDDVHFLSSKTGTQSELLHTFEALRLEGAAVVLASDGHPSHIEKLNRALMSRCLSGVVCRIDRPDPQTREQIASALLARDGFTAEPASLRCIARAGAASARELCGVVNRLKALCRMGELSAPHGELSAAAVQSALADSSLSPVARPPRMSEITSMVCTTLGVEVSELMGTGRHKRVVLARAAAALLARERTTHSFPEIATALGRRTHSTVVAACARLRRQIESGAAIEGCGPGLDEVPVAHLLDRLRDELDAHSAMAA
ncbi:MAG: DnaA/Hda family protein [Planctomycetota bacterium]